MQVPNHQHQVVEAFQCKEQVELLDQVVALVEVEAQLLEALHRRPLVGCMEYIIILELRRKHRQVRVQPLLTNSS